MKPVSQMTKETGIIQGHTANIAKIEKDLSEKIIALENEGRDPAWVKKETKTLRDTASTAAIAELAKVNEIHNVLSREREWYGDTEFLLSVLPVESKLLLMEESKRMSTSLLAAHIRHASMNNEPGKLHVLLQEMQTRSPKPDGWEGIDFSQVNLPAQKEALSLLSSAQAAYDEAVFMVRKINGMATVEELATAKLASAHRAKGEGA